MERRIYSLRGSRLFVSSIRMSELVILARESGMQTPDALTRASIASEELRRFAADGGAVIDVAARERLAILIDDLVRESKRVGVSTLVASAGEIAVVLRGVHTDEQELQADILLKLATVFDCLAGQLRRAGVLAFDRLRLESAPVNARWLGFD